MQVAVPISSEVKALQRPVAGRVTAGVAGPGRPHIATRIIIGPVRGAGFGLDGRSEVGQCTNFHKASRSRVRVLAGSNPGSSRSTPSEEGPLHATPKSRGPIPEPARLSLTPGRLGGPRGQGPVRTNPAPGKRRVDARIRNPSDAHRQ